MYREKFRSLLGRVNWRSVVASYNEHNPHNPFAWAETKLPDLLGDEAADILKDLYYESTWLGYAVGAAQIERGMQKAADTNIDWGGWTPGDALAAQKLIGTKDMPGLKQLLDKRFITMKGIEDSRYTELGNMLALGLSLGESTDATAKLIADRFDKPTGWADVVARTETRAAVTAATRDSYAEGQIEMIEWLTADGGCDICGAYEDMGPVPIDEGFDGLDGPPAHPNCLCVLVPVVGDTAIPVTDTEEELDEGIGPEEPEDVVTQITSEELPDIETVDNTYSITRSPITEWNDEKYVETWQRADRMYDDKPGDKIGRALNEMTGYDGLPHVVDSQQLTNLVENQGWTEVFRGVVGGPGEAEKFASDFRSGDFFAGRGFYGNGTYVATKEEMQTAIDYAGGGGNKGEVLRMALNPDAKVITYETLRDEWVQQTLNWSVDAKDVIYDVGNFAITRGYDAIDVPSRGYMVILNRTAVAVQDTKWG